MISHGMEEFIRLQSLIDDGFILVKQQIPNRSIFRFCINRDPSKMETFQEQEYSKSAYQKHLEDEELGVSVYTTYSLFN